MTGLEKITDQILSDAQKEADIIKSQADAECEKIKAETQKIKSEIEAKIEAEAVKASEDMKTRAKSGIAKHKRDSALSLRANMTDRAFECAVKEIISLDGEAYRALMSSLMAKVLCERAQSEKDSMRLYGENIAPQKYEVLMNKKDRDAHGQNIIDRARRATVGKLPTEVLNKIVLADRSVNIEGGFIVKCGNIELNCTVRTIVSGVRPELEEKVTAILFPTEENAN